MVSLLSDQSRTVLAATTQREQAIEGVFTAEVVKLLREAAADRQAIGMTDLLQQLLSTVPDRSAARGGGRTMTPQMAHVGSGDGEFIFIPRSVDEAAVVALKDAVSEAKSRRHEIDPSKLVPVRGVIDRRAKLAGRRTELSAVVEAIEAANRRYADTPADEIKRWDGVRRGFRRNVGFNDPLAYVGLFLCLEKGLGEPDSKADPVEAYRVAREADDIQERRTPGVGRYLLGRCYQYGLGVPKDLGTAGRLYRQGGEQGLLLAKLAYCELALAEGVGSDVAALVRRWLAEGAEAKLAPAYALLARAHQTGAVPGLNRELESAARYHALRAETGHLDSGHALYQAYSGQWVGYQKRDAKLAERHLRQGVEAGWPPALHSMAYELLGRHQQKIEAHVGLNKDPRCGV